MSVPQMPQAGQSEHLAQPQPLRSRRDPEDVDLADRVVLAAGVDLGPVEAEQLTVSLGQEETPRFEPRRLLAPLQINPGHRTLFRVVDERLGVDLQPGVLIGTDLERADRHPRRRCGQWQRRVQ